MANENSDKEDDLTKVTATDFLKELYGDPLSAETARTGRYLVIASTVCVAVVLFKVRLQPTASIPLDFGSRADVLPMLLALGVLLLLASFLLRAGTDILRDRETALLVTRYIEHARAEAALEEAREADRDMARAQEEDDYDPDPDPWWEGYGKVREAADAAVKKAEERVGIRRLPRTVRSVRKTLEIGVPVIFGLVALVISRASIAAFGVALASAFRA